MGKYADFLYEFFNRNTAAPLDRYLEIPVFLYPVVPDSVEAVKLGECRSSTNVFLIDSKMLLSPEWPAFAGALAEYVSRVEPGHRVFPAGFVENYKILDEYLSDIPGISLFEIEEERRTCQLAIPLSHMICRQLYGQASNSKAPSQVRIFISYSKVDGRELAEGLHAHIQAYSGIDAFLDTADLAGGWRSSGQIEAGLSHSVLLALHTDKYSAQEQCRQEVLLAKQHNRPLLVANCFHNGELRSFPYLGNVPHTHYAMEAGPRERFFDFLLLQALRETLRFRFNELQMDMQARLFGVKPLKAISYPPELVALAAVSEQEKGVVLYPDPPLGLEELALLEAFRPNLDFLTPAMLPLLSGEGKLSGSLSALKVGISLSETVIGPLAKYHNRSIQDLMVSIVRYSLAGGATLVYSGKLNYGQAKGEQEAFNFVRLLIELLQTYYKAYSLQPAKPMECFTFFPLSHTISEDERAALVGLAEFIDVEPPAELEISKEDAEDVLNRDDFTGKYVRAKSISRMREEMIRAEHARIVLGGKWAGYSGKMPGVLEEVLIALMQNKAVYLIGGFGGVSKGVADALQGEAPEELNLDFHEKNDPERASFIREFNDFHLTREAEKVDFGHILQFLNQTGKSGKGFGLNNGLGQEENLALFRSRYDTEIVSLILKGLKKISRA